jgi:hypothetical protein
VDCVKRLFFHDNRLGELLRSFYRALGLRPEARDEEIKAAYRKLAKQHHPDLHAGDKRAEERFKNVNEAYATLSDPGARARYDAILSQKSQRSRRAAAIMAASFALTVSVISAAIVVQKHGGGLSPLAGGWEKTESPAAQRGPTAATAVAVSRQQAVALPRTERDAEASAPSPGPAVEDRLIGPRTPELGGATPAGPGVESDGGIRAADRAAIAAVEVPPEPKAPGQLPLPEAGPDARKGPDAQTPPIEPDTDAADARAGKALAALPRQSRTDSASWASHRNARLGFSLRYPPDIFVPDPAQSNALVTHFRSRDGRATLRIVATSNEAGRTLAQYRTALIQERYRQAKFDYAPQRDTWFVLSGFAGDDIFYERVTFACDRRSLHGWMLVFPASERALYEPIIEEMHRSYRHSNGPGARCGALKVRGSVG